MATFSDQLGRSWRLELDSRAIQRVRSEADPEFLKDLPGTFDRLAADPVTLCMTIGSLCRDQWGEVTEDSFYRSLIGDAIERATEGLIQAILDFFPKRRREVLQAVATQNQKLLEAMWAAAMRTLGDAELDQSMVRDLEKAIEAAVTHWRNAYKSPESLESIPTA